LVGTEQRGIGRQRLEAQRAMQIEYIFGFLYSWQI
jgi:hypothetical protein